MIALIIAAVVGVLMLRRIIEYFTGPEEMPSARHVERLTSLIKGHSVFVASKSWCPYCRNTLDTLKAAGATPEVLQLDQDKEGSTLQKALQDMTGQRTVPQIFVGGKFIGGNSDLQAIQSSKLKEMLTAAAKL